MGSEKLDKMVLRMVDKGKMGFPVLHGLEVDWDTLQDTQEDRAIHRRLKLMLPWNTNNQLGPPEQGM